MQDKSVLEALNERQREAVTYRSAPLLVLAGPGSGKTRILTHRIAWLLQQKSARPEQILAVTFTNRAAEEMRERLHTMLGEEAQRVWIYTFHAMAVRILRRFGGRIGLATGFTILDEDEQRHAVGRILQQAGLSREQYPVSQIIDYLSLRKNTLTDPTEAKEGTDSVMVQLAGAYEEWLRTRQALDFDDLIRWAVQLLRQDTETRQYYHRALRHILVDEYQDINSAQYELLKLLAPPSSSITVVADDDQAIYGWRGSEPALIDAFIERYHAYVVKLDISYRCPPNILYGAQRLIVRQRSAERQRFLHSEVTSDAAIYHYIFHHLDQEQRWLITLIRKLIEERRRKPGEIAILYRTHRLADAVEGALVQAGLKVQRLQKESFFDEPGVRDIIRLLQLVRSLSEENFTAAVNFPLHMVDELTMIQIRRLAEKRQIGIIELARQIERFDDISPLTRVHLQRFLALLDSKMPALSQSAEPALRALFALIDTLRSPWRQEDQELLEGFMAFTDPSAAADVLADAIEAGQPLLLVHPFSVDGYAAAFLLRHALSVYLDATLTTLPTSDLRAAPDPATLVIALGDEALPIELPAAPLRIGGATPRPYALTTTTWRLAQSLLASYEAQVMEPFVIYDVETTGTHVRRDEIIEIAAARYEEQKPQGEPFYSLVRPQRGYIPPAATNVHGLTFADVEDAPPLTEVLPAFLAYVGADTVVGHNIARFDNRFIDRACGEQFGGRGFHPAYVDTLRLAHRVLPQAAPFTLSHLSEYLQTGGPTAHRAMDDVGQTAAVFFALVERILAIKEQEALTETLPLVALATVANGIAVQDENLALLHGAARVQLAGRSRDLLAAFHRDLPAALQNAAQAAQMQVSQHQAPVTPEDTEWDSTQAAFLRHIEAFQRYSVDPSLAAFLDYQALLTSTDTFAHEQDDERITLMTLHNAKGSEFPVVIIVGVEQENLPLWRTLDDPKQLAEERRVLYVGITRAKEAVYLFSTRDRNDGFLRAPSRFAFEIPSEYVRRFAMDANNRIREMK